MRPADREQMERPRMPKERLRAEFMAGAEAEWRKRPGRQMSTAELPDVDQPTGFRARNVDANATEV